MRLPSMSSLSIFTLAGLALGCAPVPDGSGSGSEASSVRDSSGSSANDADVDGSFDLDEVDGDDGDGDDVDGDGGDDSGPDSDPDESERVVPQTGEYGYSFTLRDDPCGWREVMDTFSDGVADVMPTEFDVVQRGNGFDIEAIRFGGDFGTEDSVRCTMDGSTFTCEPQYVCPVDMFLCTYGWQYEVTFTGEVLGRQRMQGTSVVRYLSVDSDTASALESVGLSAPECSQVIDMRLVWDRERER